MMRQSSTRNQRSRGWKVKHVLQICALVAVCVWLAYQVKHSHDKKKALEERNTKLSGSTEEDSYDFLKLGRKDPHEKIVMVTADDTSHNEEEENKDEEEVKHENTLEDNEEEGRGTGGNEIEENDRERADEEAEGGEEFEDEEAKEGQWGDPGLSDNQEHEGGDGKSQEAQEEHYKADDASSAVVRVTQEVDQQTEILGTENSEEQKENTEQELENGGRNNVTEDASKDGEVHDLPVDGESQQHSSTSFVETALIEREPEVGNLSDSRVELDSAGHIEEHIEEYSNTTSNSNDQMEQQNNSTIFEPNDQIDQQNNSTGTVPDELVETPTAVGVNAETVDVIPENVTTGMSSSQDQEDTVNETTMLTEDGSHSENNSTIFEPNDQIEQKTNSTEVIPYEQVETQTMPGGVNAETVDSTPESGTVNIGSALDQNTVNETTTLTEDNSNSEHTPLDQTEKTDSTGAVDGLDESPKTPSSTEENGDAVQEEATSSSRNVVAVAEDEQAAQTDLSTLLEVEMNSVEGIAAE